jgi:hypothetical protein
LFVIRIKMVISFVTNPKRGGSPAKDKIWIVKSGMFLFNGRVFTALVLLWLRWRIVGNIINEYIRK